MGVHKAVSGEIPENGGHAGPAWAKVAATGYSAIPGWARKQRELIDKASQSVVPFLRKYTRGDGEFIWRDKWPGMDGSDDAYEGIATLPLLYMLGGAKDLDDLTRRHWEAVTRQFTRYGQVFNEFDGYYDWMHHGESCQILYYMGLADPYNVKDRARALKFAGMYMGLESGAQNWDERLRMIRSPFNGSRGPRLATTEEDWCTHRWIYDMYLAPFEDIPGHETADDPLRCVQWTDDAIFEKILRLINERMTRGDVPLNLAATGLVTNAYLYSGEEKYRRWVLDYFEAWQERTTRNGGVMPDNIGLSGQIGEYNAGKWWGGYYGYRWSHGWRTIMEATLGAAANCLLLTGDYGYLDLPRSQLDLIWSMGRKEKGEVVVPHRHGDNGWFDWQKPSPRFHILLYHLSQRSDDFARLAGCGESASWAAGGGGFGKSPVMYNSSEWVSWLLGQNPAYPEISLNKSIDSIEKRLVAIDADDMACAASWDVHHWQKRTPVVPGPLSQQMMGADWLYHGCLMHARVRWFDPAERRSGVPGDVAALVERIEPESVQVTAVNTGGLPRRALLQAGAYGEHRFTTVASEGRPVAAVDSKVFEIELPPGAQVTLDIGMERFVNRPSYDFPWVQVDRQG